MHMRESQRKDVNATQTAQAFCFPPFRFDLASEELWRDGELVFLKPKALAVLRYLLEHPQRLITKAELLENVWRSVHVSDAVLKTQVSEIRLALEDCASAPRFIETAHARGYRFIAAVQKMVAAPAAPPAVALPGAATFVGREPQLGYLQRAFASAASGRRQVVFVSGAPGIGKTSLVEAFADGLSRHGGVTFARGQCVNQNGAGEPYLPLLEALARLGRAPDRAALVMVLHQHAPTWLSQLPALSQGPELPAQPTVGLGAAPERMLRELAEALEVFAVHQPLVLLFEDVHWADPSTLAWMAYVARRPDPTRLMLIATYRPLELDGSAPPLAAVKRELDLQQRCEELALPSFVRADVEAYLARRFGTHAFPAGFAELLLVHTGGSPLFLNKLLDSWIQRHWLQQEGGVWRLSAELDALRASIPASIVALIETEGDRLTQMERMVLEAASVAGVEFSAASVSAALSQEVVAIEEVCLRLARRGQFIRQACAFEWPDGTVAAGCEFIHELYRQTTYERIGAARRAQLHQRIGERQEAAYGARARDVAVELALHFQRGGDRNKALSYWRAAGEQALARSAYREAADNFEQALALLPYMVDEEERLRFELELQVAIGGALGMTRGHAAHEVERRYARARQLCRDLGETQRLTQTLSSILVFYLVRGDYRTVCELGSASSSVGGQSCEEQASLEVDVVVGIAQTFMGELAPARARLERVMTLCESTPSFSEGIQMLDTSALARTMSGVTLWLLGYPDQALQVELETLACGERLDDPCTIALASTTLTLVLQLRRESRRVVERLDASIAHSERHGFVYYLANLRMLGQFSVAEESGDWEARSGEIVDRVGGHTRHGRQIGRHAPVLAGCSRPRSAWAALRGVCPT